MTDDDDQAILINASDEVRNKLGAGARKVETEQGLTYIKKEFEGFDAEALEAILMNIVDLTQQGLKLFRESNKDHEKLNIVGSILYTLSEMYNVNVETLKHWHDLICTLPKLTAELNEELTELLGRPIDMDSVDDEGVDKLVDEVLKKEVGGDLDRLREYFDRKNRES